MVKPDSSSAHMHADDAHIDVKANVRSTLSQRKSDCEQFHSVSESADREFASEAN